MPLTVAQNIIEMRVTPRVMAHAITSVLRLLRQEGPFLRKTNPCRAGVAHALGRQRPTLGVDGCHFSGASHLVP